MDLFGKKSSPLMPSAPPKPPLPPSTPPKMPVGSSASSPYGQMPVPQVSSASIRFQETADYEKGFTEYFDEKIKPVLRNLEQERLMKLEEVKKITPKAVAVHVIGTLLGLGLTIWTKNGYFLVFGALIAWGIRTAMLNGPKQAVAGKYKQEIVPLIIKFFGNFSYSPHADPPEDVLQKSGIFESFNRSSGEDYIEGDHKGTHFRFSELSLDRSGSKSNTNIFNGMMILMDVKGGFAGQTIVKRESQKGLWASMTGKFKGMQKVPVENPEFEKIFEVYSTDLNEAARLVNPDFVTRLMQLNESHPEGYVRCCFFEGKLLIAISYGATKKVSAKGLALGYSSILPGQLFEAGSMEKSLADTEDIHKFLAQMHAILEVIETVNPPKASSSPTP